MNRYMKVLHQIAVEMDNRFQEMIINNLVIQQTASTDHENAVRNHQDQQLHEHMHQQQSMRDTMFHHMDHFNHPPC